MVKVECGRATEGLDQTACPACDWYDSGIISTLSFLFGSMPRPHHPRAERRTCLRHASDACQPHVLGAVISCFNVPVSCGGLLGKKPHFSYPQRTAAAAPYYLSNIPSQTESNVNHVLGALAIYRTASFLWHSHRVLSLLRNDVCRLHVQETYRGQCDDKG
jgi:hypothetical protein